MKYDRTDILQLIKLAFQGIEADEALQRELELSAGEISRSKAALVSPDALQGLEILFNAIYPRGREEESPLMKAAQNYPLEYLNLSPRAYNALRTRGGRIGTFTTVADLLKPSEYQLSRIPGLGQNSKSLQEIKNKRQQFIVDFHAGTLK